MKERLLIVPRGLHPRTDGAYWAHSDLDGETRWRLLHDGWVEETDVIDGGRRVVQVFHPPRDAILRDEEEMMSEESKDRHEEIEKIEREQDAKRREAERAERKETEELVAHLAKRDQNDADVQEIARQVGVFCRGLDEANVKHGPGWKSNEDRKDAISSFVLHEVSRLRRKQEDEED